jgi:uncharacterized repeat protein (TIGR01451 family)
MTMKRKTFLFVPVLISLAVVMLFIGSMTLSTAAQEPGPADHQRAFDSGAMSRPAAARQLPEWGGAWLYGPDTAFQFTRFDGEYYPAHGKVYFMGGRLASGETDGSVWFFDPDTLAYEDMGVDLITPISNYTMNLLQDGSGEWGFYIFCGRPAAGGVTPVVQVYYPETNTVAQLDPADNYPGAVSCTSGLNAIYNNKVYIAGGFDAVENHAQTWVFDPTAPAGSKWTQITTANLSIARAYMTDAVVDDMIYAIGGNYFDGASLINVATVEVLDPNAPEPVWSDADVADLPTECSEGRSFSFDTSSPFADPDNTPLGGKIISTCGRWSDEIELVFAYDVHTDLWESFPSLQTDRRDHAGAFISTSQPGSIGMPGLWVWGGRKDSDSNVLISSEYYEVNFTGGACNVLVVADDWKFESVMGGTPYYTSALDGLGVDYDVWETNDLGDPGFADMAPYGVVVWFTGYAWDDGVFTPQNEADVGAYLDAGGSFLLSSQEYHYEAGYTPFMLNYLGIASITEDVIELDPVGTASNPIGDGLGPYAMVRPDDYEIYWPTEGYEGPYDDYAYASPGAEEPFHFNASGEPNSTNYDSGVFRSIYLGWPFEWIDTVEERTEIMGAALEWLCTTGAANMDLIPPLQVGDGLPGSTVVYELTIVNNLGFAETFDIAYDGEWPLTGPDEVGPVPDGGAQAFTVEMMVPEDANCNDTGSGTVTASAQSDPEISDTSYLTTIVVPDGEGSMAGNVTDANTGLSIPDAHVKLVLGDDEYGAWTDEAGDYTLTAVPSCKYTGQVNAMGYHSQRDIPVIISNGMTTPLDASLAAGLPELSDDTVSIRVPVDGTGEFALTIFNSGTGDLNFHISDLPEDGIYPAGDYRAGLPSGIDEQVYADLKASPDSTAKFLVYFAEQADLSDAFSIQDREARGRYVLETLQATASRSQAHLRAELDAQGIEYEPRYIVNALVVKGDLNLVNGIAARPEVAYIGPNSQVPAPEPVEMEPALTGLTAVAWNVLQVNADDVWSEFGVTGEGIVVSNIDTGVLYTHPALVNQYRGNLGSDNFDHNYNWWDPYGDQPLAPYDYHSHGSHTIGTMVGGIDDEQIGMAPDGQWIACNGFKQGGWGYDAELLECAEFILAPWDLNGENPNPDLRPDIVNNSWGGGQAEWWYNQAVYAWRAAGIFPVFSNGNAGPNCETSGDPGNMANVMAVGATNNMDVIASFSSRGPALITGLTKPNVSAPGVNVYSAYNTGGYGLMSGTSMSAPHVGGQAALLWSALPELRGNVQLTYWLIEQTTLPIPNGQCGDPEPPNNVYGWGRIDAYEAVSLALSAPWETPWLSVEPNMGLVAPDESTMVSLNFDTAGLTDGACYTSTLKIEFNDPYVIETFLPVELCISDVADLQVSKSAEPTQVLVGEELTYTITVVNNGPSEATGVMLTDKLPEDVVFVSASAGCSEDGGVVVCDLGNLAAGESSTVTIQVTAPGVPGTITNEAQATSDVFDPDLSNNTAVVETVVEEPPIRKLFLPLVSAP